MKPQGKGLQNPSGISRDTLLCEDGRSAGQAGEGAPTGCQQTLKGKIGRGQTLQERGGVEQEKDGAEEKKNLIFS